MVKAKKYVLKKHFEGEPKPTDFQLVEEELPALQDGEFLVQAEYLSVDPYMRSYTRKFPVGITMIGSQVGTIIESKNPDFPVGKRVRGHLGWRTHTIVNFQDWQDVDIMLQKPHLLHEVEDISLSAYLGVLGMAGNTAYFGFLEHCEPKQGETLVVSGAAGAVGSHVGQIAKNVIGLTVIGIAGTDEKCKWLVDELGFDAAINYKTDNIESALRKAAPKGIDCYFDNVGGEISSTVLYQMNSLGRIAVCGSISSYNSTPSSLPKVTIVQPAIIVKQLKMQGIRVIQFSDRFPEAREKNVQWIREGKLRYKETITKGFENMFDAFVGMLKGQNIGKTIVEV